MTSLLEMLVVESGLTQWDLGRIIATAPRRYKVFTIPKRSGGEREIAQPAREVKVLQRILIANVLSQLPVHDAAMAYRSGRSIKDNAARHVGHGPILKLDFQDFFPSIRANDWIAYAKARTELSPNDIHICAQLFFRRRPGEQHLRLSIGAPSSPMLSNVLMFDFDTAVDREAAKRKISYTRYADDMTFSGQRIGMLKDMIDVVQHSIRNAAGPKLAVNVEKTVFATMAVRRTVTGLVLTNDGEIGLGRDRKRLISAKVHRALLGKLNAEEIAQVAGELAFANAVEPNFLQWLSNKYGSEVVRRIQRSARPKKTRRLLRPPSLSAEQSDE